MTNRTHDGPSVSVSIEELPPTARFSLRVREAGRGAAGRALGLDLPTGIGDATREGERAAVCLGPDEWLVTASEDGKTGITGAFADIYEQTPHSLVDISDRELSYRVSGSGALTLMTIGCPRNVSRLAPGRAVRTVFDNAAIIMWRDAEEDFRLDVWRSFAPYVRDLLEIGRRELAAGL